MTVWDMVSIAIFDLTFNIAFYLLLGGGLMAGLLFLVWITKQVVSHMEKKMKSIHMPNKTRFIGKGVKFERIRRITGYLVGTLDRFNDAKRAEEHDRVKHM